MPRVQPHARTATPPASGSRENCPKCGHDNGAVVYPTYSKIRELLRMPQREPYCDYVDQDEDAGGAASPIGCRCRNAHHWSLTD